MKTFTNWRLAAVLFVSLGTSAFAQSSLWLTHDSSWRIEGKELVINTAYVANPTGEDSGPLFLSIYAQSGAAYEGGAPGQLIGRAELPSSIPGSGRLDNVTVRTKARIPKGGLKFTALLLERQNGKQFTVVDWVAFTSTYAFPRKTDGGVGSDDSAIGAGNIAASSLAFDITGRRAQVTVGRIQNQREVAVTGRIRVTLYATAEPYSGGTINGPALGSIILGELAPGDYFNNINSTMTVKTPKPRGSYYVTLAVEEETDTGFVVVAYSTDSTPREL